MSRETDTGKSSQMTARGVIHIAGVRPVTAAQVRNNSATDSAAGATPAVRNVTNSFIIGVSLIGGTDTIG